MSYLYKRGDRSTCVCIGCDVKGHIQREREMGRVVVSVTGRGRKKYPGQHHQAVAEPPARQPTPTTLAQRRASIITHTYLAFMPSQVGNERNVRRRVPVVPTAPTATSTAPKPTSSTTPVRSTSVIRCCVAIPSIKRLIWIGTTPAATATTAATTTALSCIHRDHGSTCTPACGREGA